MSWRSALCAWTVVAAGACGGVAAPQPTLDPGTPRPYRPDPGVATDVRVPEVYELANVALAISRYGRDDPWSVLKDGPYYERVLAWFGGHAGDPLIAAIDPLVSASYANYYGFRENALSYRLDGDRLTHEGIYRDVWPRPDLFERFVAEASAFASATRFREFYASERTTYDDAIGRYRSLVDLAGMAGWLHDRFPGQRIEAYTVVFSPLVRGEHSTADFVVEGRREAVMFVAGPDLPLGDVGDGVRRGLHERVVFTEIDHNYVNPVTDRHRARVDEVLAEWSAWNSGQGYRSPYLTFNEYMTWAVFTLYSADAHDPETFREVARRNQRLMEGRRGFVRFGAFQREALRLYRERPDASVPELYPALLDWLAGAGRAPEPR